MINKIIARLQNESFVTIFNEGSEELMKIKESYSTPKITDDLSTPFDPEQKLASDEWFFVEPNAEQTELMISPYFETIDNIDSVNPISKEDYPNIRAICLVQKDDNTETMHITKVYPRFYTITKKLLKWSDGPALETQSSTVDFSAKTDAFWSNKRLYFKSYSSIKSVLNGLEDFYRVATEEEKNDFLQKDFFECEDLNIKVKQRNLRKIASVIETISWDDEKVRKKYIKYANKYPNLKLNISDTGKMIISDNTDLTKVLNVLEERIYTTPITKQPRAANSVTALNS
jgi:hypothetical protein